MHAFNYTFVCVSVYLSASVPLPILAQEIRVSVIFISGQVVHGAWRTAMGQ